MTLINNLNVNQIANQFMQGMGTIPIQSSVGQNVMSTVQSTASMMQNLTSSFQVSAGFAFGFGMMGGGMAPAGFMMPPNQNFVQNGFAQMALNQGWNMMGNAISQFGQQGMQQMMNPLMQPMNMIANALNMLGGLMKMAQQLKTAINPATTGKPQIPTTQGPDFSKLPGAQVGTPSFPGQAGSDFLSKLPKNGSIAQFQKLGVLAWQGSKNSQITNKLVEQLSTAAPNIKPVSGTPGKPGKAELQLSQAQVDAIRNAPDQETAKKLVLEAIGQQTGIKLDGLNPNNSKDLANPKNLQALNKLLGTNIHNHTNKQRLSSVTLDTIAESVSKSLRAGNFGQTTIQTPSQVMIAGGFAGGFMGGAFGNVNETGGMFGAMGGMWGSAAIGAFVIPGQQHSLPNPSSGVSVDLSSFVGTEKTINELASPLVFDLEGTGIEIRNGGMIDIDIDGDGKIERIKDIDAEQGLLVFDVAGDGQSTKLAGSEMFGDNTDLTAYGIKAPNEDGRFRDGFQALRALCEHYKLVDQGKQYLDANDLHFLEEKVGLRMRVGGLFNGEEKRFSDIDLTKINLGNPAQTQHLEDAPTDRWGNKIMLQDGATFVVNSEERRYVDIWFKVQARVGEVEKPEELKSFSKAQLLNFNRR
jgi:hypothetical protein